MKWPFPAHARYSNPSVRVEGGTQATRGGRNRVSIASSFTYTGDKVPGPKTSLRAKLVITDRNTNKLHGKRDVHLPPLKYPGLVLFHSAAAKIAAAQALSAPTASCGQWCPVATHRAESMEIQLKSSWQKGRKGHTHSYSHPAYISSNN